MSILLFVGFYFDVASEDEGEVLVNQENSQPEVKQDLDQDVNRNMSSDWGIPEKGLAKLMGKSGKELKETLGEPSRIDPSFYGYDWWIYGKKHAEYAQFGISRDKVVTIFAIGDDVDISPFEIGQPVGEIYSSVYVETNIMLEFKDSSYRFELSEEDVNTRPLVMVGDFYAQLYIDKFTGTLSSVRLMDAATLIKMRPYEMVYRGELLEAAPSSPVFEEEVERGKEQQILDITNVLRVRHDLDPLELDEKTAEVALAHSKDMYESNNFSHISKRYGDLADRLAAGGVLYEIAGENIAANYLDAPAVVEGWLNSKSHRESMLNEEFTHLGAGVYKKNYTQNFIRKREGE